MENLNTAFDVAEKYLDIPRMLDPDGKFQRKSHNSLFMHLFLIFKYDYYRFVGFND